MNLAHTLRDVRESVRRVSANKLNGIDADWLDAKQVKELCPIINISDKIRYPVLGATFQPRGGIAKHDHVAWAFARKCDELGVDLIQNCEVTGFVKDGNRVVGVETSRGRIATEKVGLCRGRALQRAGQARRVRPADPVPSAAGAGLRAAPAGAPDRGHVEPRARLRLAGPQG